MKKIRTEKLFRSSKLAFKLFDLLCKKKKKGIKQKSLKLKQIKKIVLV